MPSTLVKGYINTAINLLDANPAPVSLGGTATGTAPAAGDFVFLYMEAAGNSTLSNTPSPPTGFAEIVPWQAMGTSASTMWALYAKRFVDGETSYNVPQVNVGRTNRVYAHVFWIAGANAVDISSWVIGNMNTRAASGGTVSTIGLSVTTTIPDSVAFAFGVERTSATETGGDLTVSGTGWNKQLAHIGFSAAQGTITVASKGMASAGATGDVTFTSINTQATNGAALQIIIPPVGGTPVIQPGVAGKMFDGTTVVSGRWYVMGSDAAPKPVSKATMIWPGYSSISDMLSRTTFFCGHRGGSANWPEMSMQGYTQAALRGYGALELSLARSSDGVWFGLHDASLDRTSLGTGGGSGTTLVASSMTWAQIQTYTIRPATVAPVNSTVRPYAKLDDILDAYLRSHVIFIDPKAALAYRSELIAILKNRPEWQSRIVAKYVPGNSNVNWLADARAAGFVTNAMFYPSDNFATYQAQGDILGMDYNASATVWDQITAYNKPVMVHVCPTLASVSAGLANGAKGAMVSGVVQVPQVTL